MPEILAEVEESIDITATVAATPGSLTDDYNDLQNHPSINGVELEGDKSTNDLHIDHVPLADNLVATTGTTDTTPYVSRASQGPVAELRKVVGGTLAWNQLLGSINASSSTSRNHPASKSVSGGKITFTSTEAATARPWYNIYFGTITIVAGHKYLFLPNVETTKFNVSAMHTIIIGSPSIVTTETLIFTAEAGGSTTYVSIRSSTSELATATLAVGDTVSLSPVLYDLTQMFGSAVADAIATMESTTAGSGVAFFHSLFPSDYYPYSAPTLESVHTSARQALDGNGNVMRSYPLDDSLTLRGIPKLNNGQLSYDGDIYLPSGEVVRRYRVEVFDGTEAWTKSSAYAGSFWRDTGNTHATAYNNRAIICSHLENVFMGSTTYVGGTIAFDGTNKRNINVWFPQFDASTTVDQFKAYLAQLNTAGTPLTVVSLMDSATTEQANSYTEVQLGGTTEQFVTDNYIPVGNESFYPTDLTNVVQDLAPLPTSAGEYKLKVTVSGGVPSYSWVAG